MILVLFGSHKEIIHFQIAHKNSTFMFCEFFHPTGAHTHENAPSIFMQTITPCPLEAQWVQNIDHFSIYPQ